MSIPKVALSALAVAASLVASAVRAETLYKLIAPDGKVTYAQEAPKHFDGKVIRLDIDPNANTSQGKLPAIPEASKGKGKPAPTNEEIIRRDPDGPRKNRLEVAKEKFDAARKEYEAARDNPGPDDVQRVGTAKGGARPVFSEPYQRKLEKLEADMKAAQADVEKLERGL